MPWHDFAILPNYRSRTRERGLLDGLIAASGFFNRSWR